jgi:DNA-binding HxlR family transcriptional regulator
MAELDDQQLIAVHVCRACGTAIERSGVNQTTPLPPPSSERAAGTHSLFPLSSQQECMDHPRAVELFHGKWTVEILCALLQHPIRFGELKRKIPTASKKALTARLRYLQTARIVERRDLSSSVLHVEYSLTERARNPIIALLHSLAEVDRASNISGMSRTSSAPPPQPNSTIQIRMLE